MQLSAYAWIRDISRAFRSLTHAQLELIAARASVMNGCYYWTTSHANRLRASGQEAGQTVDLPSVLDGTTDSGAQHGQFLLAFTVAVLGGDPDQLTIMRGDVLTRLGYEPLVDAAHRSHRRNARIRTRQD